MDHIPRNAAESRALLSHRALARHVTREQPSPPKAENVLVFARDHCVARLAFRDYCQSRGEDGVRRRYYYISSGEQLRGWRRDPNDPRQVVLFARGWRDGAARKSSFYAAMRRQGFIE